MAERDLQTYVFNSSQGTTLKLTYDFLAAKYISVHGMANEAIYGKCLRYSANSNATLIALIHRKGISAPVYVRFSPEL